MVELITESFDKSSLNWPEHVAVIMDGNGRWAEERGKHRLTGHQAGANCLEQLVEWVADREEIQYLTVFAFAIANQQRTQEEQQGLRTLFVRQVSAMLPKLVANNIRAKVVGDRLDEFNTSDVLEAIWILEKGTSGCTGLQLNIAWNYSGQNEIERAQAAGWSVADLYGKMFDAPEVGPIDVLVRTGVDNSVGLVMRDSDFFPLLGAGATKVPMSVWWPDFKGGMHLMKAIRCWCSEAHLQGRQRSSLVQYQQRN